MQFAGCLLLLSCCFLGQPLNLNMKKIRNFANCFEQQILPKDLPKFRGAISQKAGQNSSPFHNHVVNEKEVPYKGTLLTVYDLDFTANILLPDNFVRENGGGYRFWHGKANRKTH